MHGKHFRVPKMLPMHCKKHTYLICLNTFNGILPQIRFTVTNGNISLEVLKKQETHASYNAWEALWAREDASHALQEALPKNTMCFSQCMGSIFNTRTCFPRIVRSTALALLQHL